MGINSTYLTGLSWEYLACNKCLNTFQNMSSSNYLDLVCKPSGYLFIYSFTYLFNRYIEPSLHLGLWYTKLEWRWARWHRHSPHPHLADSLEEKKKDTQEHFPLKREMLHITWIVHGILQARMLEWVAFPFSRGSSQPRDWTQVSHITGGFFTSWATREAQEY